VQPLMTLVAGVVIFGEIPTPGQLVGALILFGGVLVAARKSRVTRWASPASGRAQDSRS